MSDAGRQQALQQAIKEIVKRYGEGAVMRLGEARHLMVEAIPTGALSLDIAIGIGGVPRGRITEIFGPEASGKTTLTLHIVAEAQKMGGVAAFIDMEHALDPSYAERIGVDVENLLISQPDTGEQALESGGRGGRGLGRRAGPPGGNRGRHGRRRSGNAGSVDVPGLAQTGGHHPANQDGHDFHQPAAAQNRRDVRQPGDHPGRSGPQVLRVGAAGHPTHPGHQAGQRGHRKPGTGEGREEQSGTAFPYRGIRHHLQRRHLPGRGLAGPGRGIGHHRQTRFVLRLRGFAPGPGTREREAVLAGTPRPGTGPRRTPRAWRVATVGHRTRFQRDRTPHKSSGPSLRGRGYMRTVRRGYRQPGGFLF